MQIVLAGNPNSGKTSLFNYLTGSKQHVGNWPGVTVEKKEGMISAEGKNHVLVDLPGIYTLDPDTIEQKVARDYILKEKPDLIINILDATNLRRNLYFTLQLREFGVPMVMVLNMMDEVNKNGTIIHLERLRKIFGVPVIGISAAKGTGIQDLRGLIAEVDMHKIDIQPFCSGCESCSKCQSGEYRYRFIDNIIEQCVETSETKKRSGLTERIDRIVLNKYLAFPIFFVIMFLMFSLTFGGLVTKLSDVIEFLLSDVVKKLLLDLLTIISAPAWLISLVCNGIISGIGTVLIFLPQIAALFILMSLLEDSGYMARAAVMMDKVFSFFGLSGSSFIPLIMGFGCAVPAVMACRILPSEKDRKLTIMLTSFISCSARLPLYALLAGVFFSRYRGLVVFSVYMLGILVAILSAILLNKTIFKSNSASFVMELPPYRLPKLKNLVLHTWERVKGFLIKAGTVLLAASVVVWFFQSFTVSFQMTSNPENSLWAAIGRGISPLFAPLGFGNWIPATALITGIPAKEMVVTTISVLTGANGNTSALHQALGGVFSPLSAYSFMCFTLLYTPCISTIVMMKREFNSLKWTVGTIAFDFSVAWVVTFLIFQVGRMFGL
ncbi:MAG TPA: ferrous iron transport protein B [Clostridia bacterium]|nr:ferrous iron transport protein B [Clostridia bacterium]